MFLEFYGLREQPFGVTADPRFLYLSAVHREALASLIYGIEAGLGFSTLIAEPGMGKTTLLNRILSHFRSSARTAFIFETQCSSRELLRNVLLELEITDVEDNDDNVTLLNRLKRYLIDQIRSRRHVLLMVDEAQNLDDGVLETIRLLSNFETYRTKLLHIVLAGQLQLANKISSPEMAQLRQRINQANRLRPLQPEDTVKYIAHRLKLGGYGGDSLFTPEALAAIASWSRGVPREINRLCFNSMSLACALQRREVDAEIMREVMADLAFDGEESGTRQPHNLDLSVFELAAEFRNALAKPLPCSGSNTAPPEQQGSGTHYARVAVRHAQRRSFSRTVPRRPGGSRSVGVEGVPHRRILSRLSARRKLRTNEHAQCGASGSGIGIAVSATESSYATPASSDTTPLGRYEVNRKPQPAIIASLVLSGLMVLWLLVASGTDESIHAGSRLNSVPSSSSLNSQQLESGSDGMKNERLKTNSHATTRTQSKLQKASAKTKQHH